MTIIRLITNNYLQTLCSLSSSCGETEPNIALQNPLPSPTRIPLLSVSPSLYPTFSALPSSRLGFFIPSVSRVVLVQSRSISSLRLTLLCPLLFPSPRPSILLSVSGDLRNLSPLHTFSLLNPSILFIYVQGMLLSASPPLSGSFSPWKINHPLCISSHLSS